MRNLKKVMALVAVVGVVGVAGMAYAVSTNTPADIISGLTGKTVEDVNKERVAGKTYGAIAKEDGKLDEFKGESLKIKKVVLDQKVKYGSITQEKADALYNNIKNNQAVCDGTGNANIGRNAGIGFGQGKGMGRGQGCGLGACNN